MIFFKVTKITIKKITNIIQRGHGDIALTPEPCIFKLPNIPFTIPLFILKHKFTVFCNTFRQQFFENFLEKKWFKHAKWFVFGNLLKKWGSIISGRLHRGPNDEIMALKLTISTFII